MSDADVTITLGRSGQVVKKSRAAGRGSRTHSRPYSGSKRSLQDTFGSRDDASLSLVNKRVRGDDDSGCSGLSSLGGARIGRDDLRLKLMRKRMSQSQRMVEARGKNSRALQSSEQSQRSPPRSIPLTRTTSGLPPMDSLRSSNSSRTPFELQPNIPDTFVKTSTGISAASYINGMRKVALARPIEASRTQRVATGDVIPLRSRAPVPLPARTSLDASKSLTGLPSSAGMLRISQCGAPPLTVSKFLHSLGLGKYAIHFQAEEVDMTALKQMGDRDLKELGLPMGPRKKILLALLPPPKQLAARPTA